MITELVRRCTPFASGRHLLVFQDTSSFNFNSHGDRIKKDSGLGTIEDNLTLGFFLHASIVIDAFSETMLGFSDLQLWHRKYDDPDREAKIRRLPIEQKESYKWLKACQATKNNLGAQAASITFVEDREGDIYEQFALIPDKRTHFVIRMCKERRLDNGSTLFTTLSKQPVCGNYSINITADPRKKKSSRIANLEVRFAKVTLRKPDHYPNKELAQTVDVFVVEAVETGYTGKDRVCWKLVTTHSVTCFEEALGIVQIYRKRWYIEQLFRLLKLQGFEMESSQLESGWAIRKLCIYALHTVMKVMQLMLATEEEEQTADYVFNRQEQQCLKQLNHQYQGKTTRQSNPYRQTSLLWAKWIIARLGGWKGYKSQRTPGPITLKRGLDIFNQIFNGWCLALSLSKDVGTQ